MGNSEIRVTVTCDTSAATQGLSSLQSSITGLNNASNTTTTNMSRGWDSIGKSISTAGVSMIAAGNSIQQVFKPMASVLTESIKKSVDFQDAFAGVRKTVTASEEEFDELQQGIRDMAKRMPETTEEISKVMEVAGQLGIRGSKNLLQFTETAVMLGDTTNMSSEEAATSLAKFLNITGNGTETIGKLGACIVDLGNNAATTEADITEMGLRIAAAGSQIGLTDASIMGFATTLSSLGINAEAGGTAFSKLLLNMQLAAEKGGESLENFASVAGMSASDFQKAFQEDAAGALMTFIAGLGDTERNGKSAVAVLDEMGIKEVRLRDAILRLVGATDLMSDNQERANEAFEDGEALQEEAAKRYATTASQLKILKNNLSDIGITIGTYVLPYVNKAISFLQKVINKIAKVNPAILTAIGVIGALGVAFGAILSTLGLVVTGIGGVITAFGAIKGAVLAVAGVVTGPIALIVAAVVGIALALKHCWETSEEFRTKVTDAFNRVKTVVSEVVNTAWTNIQSVWGKIKPFVTKVFEGAADIIGSAFTLILDIVVPIIEGVWNTISTVWGEIGPFVESTFGALVEVLGGIWDSIYSVIKGTIDLISNLINGDFGACKDTFTEMSNGFFEGAKEAFNAISTHVEEWMPKFIEKIGEIKDKAVEKFGEIKDGIIEKINEWISDIPGTIHEFGGALTDEMDKIAEDLPEVIDGWKEVIVNKIEGWKDAIPNAMTGLKDAILLKVNECIREIPIKVQETVDALLLMLRDPTQYKVAMKEGLFGIIMAIEEESMNIVKSLWNLLKNTTLAVSRFCFDIYRVVGETWLGIGKATGECCYSIGETMGNLWDSLCTSTSIAWDGIKTAVGEGTNNVKNSMSNKWDEIKTNTSEKWNNIKTNIGTKWDEIKTSVSAAMDNLKTSTSNKWDEIKNNTSNTLTNIKNNTNDSWNNIKTSINDKMTNIKTNLKTKWDEIKTSISTTVDSIKNNTGNKWNDIKNSVSNTMSDMKNGISSKWNEIKNSISNKAGEIMDAIKKPFADAWNYIKDIPRQIKEAFNFQIKLPSIPLPHFKVTKKPVFDGLFSVPDIDVSWWAKGGFFDGASIIGVGEAGKEAVLPLENQRNMKPYAQAVASLMNDMNGNDATGNVTVNINMSDVTIRDDRDINKLAEQLQRLIDREGRRRGVVRSV